MGLFSRSKLPANLSGSGSMKSVGPSIPATLSLPKLETDHSCTFLMGAMNTAKGNELVSWLEKEVGRMTSYTPQEIVWSVAKTLDINWFYLPDRELIPLENYSLYQVRLKEYPYYEVSEIIKAAKISLRRGNPLEFVYSSVRNFLNDSWQEPSVHTVVVKRMDQEGFVGETALGPRRFNWQRVEGAALLAGEKVEGEKALRFEFLKRPLGGVRGKVMDVRHRNSKDSHLVISLGDHRGKGLYSYGIPHFETKDVGFGNS